MELDLKTLEYVKLTMDICSDNTHFTMGYKGLVRLIEETKLNNLLKPDVSGSSCDDFTDEEDYIDEPCPTCGDVNGMVNPCCAGYDPLHFRNCGYG
jgi:hypothetical protein